MVLVLGTLVLVDVATKTPKVDSDRKLVLREKFGKMWEMDRKIS